MSKYTYRYTFKTFNKTCSACPFSIRLQGKVSTAADGYHCLTVQRPITDVYAEPPAWCPREAIDENGNVIDTSQGSEPASE